MATLQSINKSSIVKVFMSGNSQAVRLPKEFRFDVNTLTIQKIGDSVVLTPKKSEPNTCWDDFADALQEFDSGFIDYLDCRENENQALDLAEQQKNKILDNLF